MAFNKFLLTSVLVAVIALSGCGEKSVQFFVDNPDEGAAVLAKCPRGVDIGSDKNCINADEARRIVLQAKINEQREARRAALKEWRNEADAQASKK